MIAVGIGCRRGAGAAAVVALVREAVARAGVPLENVTLFADTAKANEAGVGEAAARLGRPLVYLPRAALEAAAPAAETRSDRVVALFGVPSLAETAALAGAGEGGRLIVARITGEGVACAVAMSGASPP